jgi:uncharacterized protein
MAAKTPVCLRGHHLICLQFFRGEGYSDEFVENLTHVLARAATEPVLVVSGIDNVCAACPELGSDGRCASEDAGGEEEIARIDELALGILDVKPGQRVSLAEVRGLLESDAIGVGTWRAEACHGCAWESVCEDGWDAMVKCAEKAARASES